MYEEVRTVAENVVVSGVINTSSIKSVLGNIEVEDSKLHEAQTDVGEISIGYSAINTVRTISGDIDIFRNSIIDKCTTISGSVRLKGSEVGVLNVGSGALYATDSQIRLLCMQNTDSLKHIHNTKIKELVILAPNQYVTDINMFSHTQKPFITETGDGTIAIINVLQEDFVGVYRIELPSDVTIEKIVFPNGSYGYVGCENEIEVENGQCEILSKP